MRRARSLEEGEWLLIIDCWLFTHNIFSAVFIKLRKFLIIDCLHTENTEGNGGPQADFMGERESSEFKRNLNGCPQADDGGEQQLENNKYPQMSQMDTDGGPQADDGGGTAIVKNWTAIKR